MGGGGGDSSTTTCPRTPRSPTLGKSRYIFWLHVEEIQGQFNWTDNRDLRGSLVTAASVNTGKIPRRGNARANVP